MENNPQPSNTQPAPALRRTILIIVCLLLTGAIAIGIVTLLRNITPKPSETSPTTSALPAEGVIDAVKTPGTIKSLESFSQQDNPAGGSRIIYKANDRNYTVSVPAKSSVLFVAKTMGPYSDAAKTEGEIATFMTGKGYEKTENTGAASSSPSTYFTFKSPVGVCQVASSQPTQGQQTFAFYEVGCVENSAIAGEYSTIEMLLRVYEETAPLPSFNDASRSSSTEDNKSLSVINLRGDATRKLLLFAAIDNKWEFIGNLNDAQARSSGKYGISPEVQSKIDDARFGNFLKNHIQ